MNPKEKKTPNFKRLIEAHNPELRETLVEVQFEDAIRVVQDLLLSVSNKTKEENTRNAVDIASCLLIHAVDNFRTVDGWKSEGDKIGLEAQAFTFLTKIPVIFEGGAR